MGLLDLIFGKRKKKEQKPSQASEQSRAFYALQLENYVRIITESYDIIMKTKSPETFFERFDLIFLNVEEAMKVSSLIKTDTTDLYSLYSDLVNNRQDIIRDFILRYWSATIKDVNSVKTNSAKQSRVQNFYDSLKKYDRKMDNENIDLYTSKCYNEMAVAVSDNSKSKNTDNLITYNNKAFSIHPSLVGLLYISSAEDRSAFKEPSTIFTKLPLSSAKPEKLPYYPAYYNSTPEQRYAYLKFLSNPYQECADIGYVFILYYGLERQLIEGDYKRAFDVILELRKIHSNGSFQLYSLNALLIACTLRLDCNLRDKLYDSFAENDNIPLSIKLFIVNNNNNKGLSVDDIINNSRSFGFTNHRYIKENREWFADTMKTILINRYQADYLPVRIDVDKIQTKEPIVLANISLKNRTFKIPDLTSDEHLRQDIFDVLQKTHDSIKTMKAQQRKGVSKPHLETDNGVYNISANTANNDEWKNSAKISITHPLEEEQMSSNPKFHRTQREEKLKDNFYFEHYEQLRLVDNEIYEAVQQAKTFEDNIDDKIELCNKAIRIFYDHKKFCSQSEGGKLYFADYWEHCHNSRKECFSFIEDTEELLKELQANYDDYNEYYTTLKTLDKDLLKFLSDNAPILQRDIYKHFNARLKYNIQKYIRDFQESGLITREKKGNSYIIRFVGVCKKYR